MITEENLGKIYDEIIKEEILTTKELKDYGFSSNDLTKLVNTNILTRIKRGTYTIASTDILFDYVKQLLAKKENSKATAYLEKIYQLDPTNTNVCYYIFINHIIKGNYVKALEYFDKFFNIDEPQFNPDANLYLCLLEKITELPEKYQNYVNSLTLNDIMIDVDERSSEKIKEDNKVRIQIFRNDISTEILNYFNAQSGEINSLIIRRLLYIVFRKRKNDNKMIIKKLEEENYEWLIDYFNVKEEQSPLNNYDRYCLYLTQKLVEISKTNIIPTQRIYTGDNTFRAIDNNNFELAIALYEEKLIKNNKINKNYLYNILKKINEKIKQLRQEKRKYYDLDANIHHTETITKTSAKYNNQTINFAKVIKYIVEQDFDNLFPELRNYLIYINKIEYEFLIINLIKLSILHSDLSFSKPLLALAYLDNDRLKFVLSEYIKKFYEAIATRNFEEAKIYLEIISQSSKIGYPCTILVGLKQIFDNTFTKNNPSNKVLNSFENSLYRSQTLNKEINTNVPVQKNNSSVVILEKSPNIVATDVTESKASLPQSDKLSTQQSSKKIFQETHAISKISFNAQKIIDNSLETVMSRGILLLKPMPNVQMREIHNLIELIPEFVSFEVEMEGVKQICLRYLHKPSDKIDITEILASGSTAYNNKQYDECINIYKKLLVLEEVKSLVYAKIGLAYMKKGDKLAAIDYLTVATDLNKKQNGKYDFTNLIYFLKERLAHCESKPYIKMSELDFEDDINNYYGIENIEKIANLISNGTTIDKISDIMNFDEETKNVTMLILAREYYAQGNYVLGDNYLKKVERSKNKTPLVKQLLKKIITNKKFYKNRLGEEHKSLILTKKVPKC